MPGERNPHDACRIAGHFFLPAREIYSSGEWCQHYELRKRDPGLLCERRGRLEGFRSVGRESENEGAEDVYSVVPESP